MHNVISCSSLLAEIYRVIFSVICLMTILRWTIGCQFSLFKKWTRRKYHRGNCPRNLTHWICKTIAREYASNFDFSATLYFPSNMAPWPWGLPWGSDTATVTRMLPDDFGAWFMRKNDLDCRFGIVRYCTTYVRHSSSKHTKEVVPSRLPSDCWYHKVYHSQVLWLRSPFIENRAMEHRTLISR